MQYEKLDRRELLIASILYRLMINIPKDEKHAKKERSSIIRSIKNCIFSTARQMAKEEYLKDVENTTGIMEAIKNKMMLEEVSQKNLNMIAPSSVIDILENKDKKLISKLMLNKKHRKSMRKVYKDSNLVLPSLMYVNRLLEEIDRYLEENKDG